jgi:Effector-associated domain 10
MGIMYKEARLRQSFYFEPDRGDHQTEMFIPEELVDIIKRISSGTHTDADLQRLGQIFCVTVAAGERSIAINQDTNGATIATGDGNTIINIIFQADGFQIGENVYQGYEAKRLKSILQEIKNQKVSIDGQTNTRHILPKEIENLISEQNQPRKTTTSLKINTTRRDVLLIGYYQN